MKSRCVVLQEEEMEETDSKCVFCGKSRDWPEKYGKMYKKKDVAMHHFCALFSSGLWQRGDADSEGTSHVSGFLLADIKKEVSRATRLRCSFCQKGGASIGCVIKNCRYMYHFPCGLENGVLYRYYDTFCSFCLSHREIQPELPKRSPSKAGETATCPICVHPMQKSPSIENIYVPCCRDGWIHRTCLQAQASAAGVHFFRCPLCNNKDEFQEEMLTYGIYIPDQDAAWEREPNAFTDLLQRHCKCDVEGCLCPKGKDYNKLDTKWEVVLCDICGSAGCHMACGKLITPTDDWTCSTCAAVVGPAKPPKRKGFTFKKRKHSEVNANHAKPKSRKRRKIEKNSMYAPIDLKIVIQREAFIEHLAMKVSFSQYIDQDFEGIPKKKTHSKEKKWKKKGASESKKQKAHVASVLMYPYKSATKKGKGIENGCEWL